MDREEVDRWVERYKEKHPDGVWGWLYGCDILETLLKYDGSCGIWFFKGINDEGKERLVMYPADHEGNILHNKMKSLGAMVGGKDDDPADDSEECPPDCPGGFD